MPAYTGRKECIGAHSFLPVYVSTQAHFSVGVRFFLPVKVGSNASTCIVRGNRDHAEVIRVLVYLYNLW